MSSGAICPKTNIPFSRTRCKKKFSISAEILRALGIFYENAYIIVGINFIMKTFTK